MPEPMQPGGPSLSQLRDFMDLKLTELLDQDAALAVLLATLFQGLVTKGVFTPSEVHQMLDQTADAAHLTSGTPRAVGMGIVELLRKAISRDLGERPRDQPRKEP